MLCAFLHRCLPYFSCFPPFPKATLPPPSWPAFNSDVYHVSSCFYVDRIKESNRIWFTSAEEAEASGRRGCSHCQPEQYKSSPSQESQEDPAQSPQEQSQPNSSVQSTQQETPSTSAYVNSEETHFRKNTSEGMMLDIKGRPRRKHGRDQTSTERK